LIVAEGLQAFAKVSVVIVTWNHCSYLEKCLEGLSTQIYPAIEVTIVDNASRDGSAEWVANFAPHVRLIRMQSNLGFSRAFNLGARESDGEFILSLNPDVSARPDFISNMVAAAQEDSRIGIVAPKLLHAEDKKFLDSTGLFVNRQRRPYDRGQMKPDFGQYDENTEIFGACGAAALYRRSMLKDLALNEEYFDEDFFAYYEDADLAWRAKLRGWRCVFSAKAVGEHVRGWGDTLRKRPNQTGLGPRLALRNRFLMIIKNDSVRNFLVDAPLIFLAEIPRLFYMIIFRRDALKGIVDIFQLAPRAREKRKMIRSNQIVSDRDLRSWFKRND
jgi:GT2 family glycosyltransferase